LHRENQRAVRGETLSRRRQREARNGETARGEARGEVRGETLSRKTARGESGVDSEFRQRRGVRLLRWWWLLLGGTGEWWERQQRWEARRWRRRVWRM
jgi:hypothetical protein